MKELAIFIFRRDLRLKDNTPLTELSKNYSVIPIFIFDPYQIKEGQHNKKYRSENAIQFMFDCLIDLSDEIKDKKSKLYFFYGEPHKIIESLLRKNKNIKAVGFNLDFSNYSVKRDRKIINVCNKRQIKQIVYKNDLTLNDIDSVLTNNNEPYTVFSSYYKKAKLTKPNLINKGRINLVNRTYKLNLVNDVDYNNKFRLKFIDKINDKLPKGGRKECRKILNKISTFNNYNKKRDVLTYETTRLSPYLKFGCYSIREVYYVFKDKLSGNNDLIKQLYWRSFYFVMAKHSNNTFNYKHIEKRFEKLKWSKNNKLAKMLWEGKTGYPIIDSAVRQLNETGFMHNRGRLLVANFAIKVLHINPFGTYWSGQEYFSRKLIDCCYANNYGNWLWILGPYDPSGYRFGKKNTFSGRIFRNVISFKKYDPKLMYIRKWIPELKDVDDKDIFSWYSKVKNHNEYFEPIVDYNESIKKWFKLTKK